METIYWGYKMGTVPIYLFDNCKSTQITKAKLRNAILIDFKFNSPDSLYIRVLHR